MENKKRSGGKGAENERLQSTYSSLMEKLKLLETEYATLSRKLAAKKAARDSGATTATEDFRALEERVAALNLKMVDLKLLIQTNQQGIDSLRSGYSETEKRIAEIEKRILELENIKNPTLSGDPHQMRMELMALLGELHDLRNRREALQKETEQK